MSGYLMKPIKDNEDFKEEVRKVKSNRNGQKQTKTAKRMIVKGDSSLDALFSRLWERLKLFWTSHMSGYLEEPIRDNEDFKEGVRNVKNSIKQIKG